MREPMILRIIEQESSGWHKEIDILPHGFDIKRDREFWKSFNRTARYFDIVERT
jgi:hypothetical protein